MRVFVHSSEISLKEHRARALFDAASCDLASCTNGTAVRATVKTVCRKLFSVQRFMFLQFSKSIHLHQCAPAQVVQQGTSSAADKTKVTTTHFFALFSLLLLPCGSQSR